MPTNFPTPLVPLSWGEVIDKITILEIKSRRLTAPQALANVGRELSQLRTAAAPVFPVPGMADLVLQLETVNELLWDIEDRIRAKEHAGAFDGDFTALARSVYQRNDERAVLKRQINRLLASEFVEEKSYWTP